MKDPLSGSFWSRAETVSGFSQSPPNDDLMQYAAAVLARGARGVALDLGCGAGRNAVPLALQGWTVIGTDLSAPMLLAARRRASEHGVERRLYTFMAPMHHLPVADRCCRLVIAHGIWNLARSTAEFRQAVREAARVAAPDAALFVFTFSRSTLPPDVQPVPGEAFVFTQFSGEPQCFLTEEQLRGELRDAGFDPDPALPLRELNRRPAGAIGAGGPPVIYQATFRRRS